jgi:hypothetical protein
MHTHARARVCVCGGGDFIKYFQCTACQRLRADRKIQRYIQMCKMQSNKVNAY